MSKYLTQVVAVIALLALGYFIRAYTEKPKVIEVPKERVVTRTTYIDKITKVPVEVETERVVYDTEAAVEIERLKKPKVLVGLAYGLERYDNQTKEVYGAWAQKRILGPIYVGAALYSNESAFLTLGTEF